MCNGFAFERAEFRWIEQLLFYPNINKTIWNFTIINFSPFKLIKEALNMKPLAADEMFEGIDIDDVREIEWINHYYKIANFVN